MWLSNPRVWIPAPGSRRGEILAGTLKDSRACGNLVPDAHIAALALEHGPTLFSTDDDFTVFPDVQWVNPLSRQLPKAR